MTTINIGGHGQYVPLTLMVEVPFERDDGGRAAAGFRGSAGDCVTRAIAIATERPYVEVYHALNALALAERPRRGRQRSSSRNGVRRPTSNRYLLTAGWHWVPTMRIGSGCTVHLRPDELPSGRLIVSLSRHIVAVVDGVIHDTDLDVARGGTRCVYGYWKPCRRKAAEEDKRSALPTEIQ